MRKLRIGVIGRTEMLLDSTRRIQQAGHEISFVATCKVSGHELSNELDFREFATRNNVPFIRHKELTSLDGRALIAATRSDLAISMNWLTLIPSSIRELFPFGVFNAHPGDLPRFKGNACPNWAILLGEQRIALTIHQMADELDCGPIATKKYLDINTETAIGDVYDWLRRVIPDAFLSIVDAIAAGELALAEQPKDRSVALRCYPRRDEDGRIDWRASLVEVSRLIRASGRPFSGAFSLLENKRLLRIWRAEIVPTIEPFVAIPGQVAYAYQQDPVIAGVDGYLRLTDISLEGCANSADSKVVVLSSLRNRLI